MVAHKGNVLKPVCLFTGGGAGFPAWITGITVHMTRGVYIQREKGFCIQGKGGICI